MCSRTRSQILAFLVGRRIRIQLLDVQRAASEPSFLMDFLGSTAQSSVFALMRDMKIISCGDCAVLPVREDCVVDRARILLEGAQRTI
jgi:hypothetical protein